MESKRRSLSQYLTGLIESLHMAVDDGPCSAAAEGSSPHLELIDFDELAGKLHETAAELNTADSHDRERDVIRRWFIVRITSLQRGHQAILSENRSVSNPVALDDATLPELARRFEEESARLRSTAVNHHLKTASEAIRKTPDFREFKS